MANIGSQAQNLYNSPPHPFVCCAEPIVDLSHEVSELLPVTTLPQDFILEEDWQQPNRILHHDELLFSVYGEKTVFAPLERMLGVDYATYRHSLRVGSCAAQAAVKLGLATEESKVAVRAALLHDLGKIHPVVQQAIHSTETVCEKPALYDAIRQHPWHGLRLLTPFSHSKNVLQVVGNHHSLQTDRPSYGVFTQLHNMPERNGRRPNTRRLLEIVAAADLFDAVWTAPLTQERPYQRFTHESYRSLDFLRVALESLSIADSVRQTVFDFAVCEHLQAANNRLQ